MTNINGIKVTSYLQDMKTGETVPYEPWIDRKIMISILEQMIPEEVLALPKALQEGKPTIAVEISGRKITAKEI